MHKKINVSPTVHQRIDQEAGRLKLSHKDYVEAATAFFLDRQTDPRTYQPQASRQIIEQAVDRLFSYLVFQEKHLLRAIQTEATKARIMGELSVNHLLRLMTDSEASFQEQQQEDQHYLAERLAQALPSPKPSGDGSK